MLEKSLTKIPNQELEPVGLPIEASFVDKLIEKSVDSKAAVEVLKELRQMREDDRRNAAEASFDAAMSKFQAECPVIEKTRGVKTNAGDLAYRYAPLERIEEVIRPIERANNFSHTFDQDVASREGYVITVCSVTHTDPDPRIGSFTKEKKSMFPLGTRTPIMSATQQAAAALSFANRRTLANAYGLVIAGEDKDGAGTDSTKPRVDASKPVGNQPTAIAEEGRKLRDELWKLLGPERRGKAQNFDMANQWLWKEEILDAANVSDRLPDLSNDRLKKVIERVREKLC